LIYTQYGRQYVDMCSDMSDMCERDPVCDIPPIHGKSAKDTRAGRSAAVDMAEPGDTLEKIAADELARILKVTEVLKGIPDNAMRKARQEKMLAQIDDEMEMRRAAVIRRLKTSAKLEVQLDRAARDERRPTSKKVRKYQKMELDEHIAYCAQSISRSNHIYHIYYILEIILTHISERLLHITLDCCYISHWTVVRHLIAYCDIL